VVFWFRPEDSTRGHSIFSFPQIPVNENPRHERRFALFSYPLFLFARNFFRSPAMLGSVVPSSRFLVRTLLSRIEWDRARILVEYGPGVGTFTREILKKMRPDATLVVIELNPTFVSFLRHEIRDPRLRIIYGSAAGVRAVLEEMGSPSADYIISGIPYSTLPDSARREILHESRQMLSPKGAFLVYQFTGTVLPYLQSSFRSVRQDFELLNILPARIFCCSP
jgi:phospholipid N-methyltransferase